PSRSRPGAPLEEAREAHRRVRIRPALRRSVPPIPARPPHAARAPRTRGRAIAWSPTWNRCPREETAAIPPEDARAPVRFRGTRAEATVEGARPGAIRPPRDTSGGAAAAAWVVAIARRPSRGAGRGASEGTRSSRPEATRSAGTSERSAGDR